MYIRNRSKVLACKIVGLLVLASGASTTQGEDAQLSVGKVTELVKDLPSIEFVYKSTITIPFLPGVNLVKPRVITGRHEFKYDKGKFFYKEILSVPDQPDRTTLFAYNGKLYQTFVGDSSIMSVNRDTSTFQVDRLKYLPLTLPFNFLLEAAPDKYKPLILALGDDWGSKLKQYDGLKFIPSRVDNVDSMQCELHKLDRRGEQQLYKLYFANQSPFYPCKWESTDRDGVTDSILVKRTTQLKVISGPVTIPLLIEYQSCDAKGRIGMVKSFEIDEKTIQLGRIMEDNEFDVPSSLPNYIHDEDLDIWLKSGAN